MKKLMTILVVFAMCGTALAQMGWGGGWGGYGGYSGHGGSGSSSSTMGPNLSTGHYKYEKGVYTLLDDNNDYTNNLTMNYTSSADHIGKAYFTTMSAEALDEYNKTNKTNYNTVVVQFLGTDIDDTRHSIGHASEHLTDKLKDFGIYLYDKTATGTASIGQMYSFENGNSFALDPGTDFGIYYKTDSREWYSTENFVGTYDPDKHYINYYDENGVYHEHEEVDIRFTCAFMTDKFGDHWEFMLETKLDDPYYNVDPNDKEQFAGNGDVEIPSTSGQPLPGTLATLLIGGLCAGSLRKRNKK